MILYEKLKRRKDLSMQKISGQKKSMGCCMKEAIMEKIRKSIVWLDKFYLTTLLCLRKAQNLNLHTTARNRSW